MTLQESRISRRNFCNNLLLTSTGIVLVGREASAQVVIPQDSAVAYPPVKIEGAEKLLAGSSLYFDYPTSKDPAVLLRSNEGEYAAYSRKCTHAGCSLDFDAARRCLKCPCHQGTFDTRVGNVMYGPPQRPLDQIVLQVRAGGQVWAVGKRIGANGDIFAKKL